MILYNPYTKEKFEAELIGEEDDMYICKDETGKEFRWLKEYAQEKQVQDKKKACKWIRP